VKVQFHGHACFSISQGGTHLLLDPFTPSGLHGAVQLRRPAVAPTHLVCTHQHADHAAVAEFPTAKVVAPGFTNSDLQIEGLTVDHDMHNGRLRGGQSTVLRIRTDVACVVHLGDIGERLTRTHIEWLRERTPDLMIVPAGGWYTLDAGGAIEAIRLVRPLAAWACHTSDDGVKLPALEHRELLLQLWSGAVPQIVSEWTAGTEPENQGTRLLLGHVNP
jgi:L-ascorbate metabolism protein UlaG (beta-lactamase superfamily)